MTGIFSLNIFPADIGLFSFTGRKGPGLATEGNALEMSGR
jgi:hypothetical protein